MAVLKRGDKPKALLLDSGRKFSSSFAMAWNLWTSHFKSFFMLSWQPCVIAGVLGMVWLFIHSSSVYLISIDSWELSLNFIMGALLLFLMSMMRIRQLDYLHQLTSDTTLESPSFFKSFLALAKKAWKTYIPLFVAWLLAFSIVVMVLILNLEDASFWICIAVAVALPFPLFGMVQSYSEISLPKLRLRGSLLTILRKGFGLNANYFGGMFVIWLLSAVLLAIMLFLLVMGEVVLTAATEGEALTNYLKEPFYMPGYVVVLRYVVMFVMIFVMTLLHSVWSLPQQVHMYSIITKDNGRPKKKSRPINTNQPPVVSNA